MYICQVTSFMRVVKLEVSSFSNCLTSSVGILGVCLTMLRCIMTNLLIVSFIKFSGQPYCFWEALLFYLDSLMTQWRMCVKRKYFKNIGYNLTKKIKIMNGQHSVHFGLTRFYSIYSVHFGLIQSYSIYSVHFGPIQSIQSTLVLFGPLQSYSVHFGRIRSTLVVFGPLWFFLVQFGLIRSTMVLYSPH